MFSFHQSSSTSVLLYLLVLSSENLPYTFMFLHFLLFIRLVCIHWFITFTVPFYVSFFPTLWCFVTLLNRVATKEASSIKYDIDLGIVNHLQSQMFLKCQNNERIRKLLPKNTFKIFICVLRMSPMYSVTLFIWCSLSVHCWYLCWNRR